MKVEKLKEIKKNEGKNDNYLQEDSLITKFVISILKAIDFKHMHTMISSCS